jgi:hypothetical protein
MTSVATPALGSAVTQELEEVGDLPRPQQPPDEEAEGGGDGQDDQDPGGGTQDMIVPSAHLV